MKTKKSPVRKKPGARSAGDVFGRMLEKSELFEYRFSGFEDGHWERWLHVRDIITIQDGWVRVWDVLTCKESNPVVVKGDTVEVKVPGARQTCLFRFYTAPRRIKSLKEVVR